MREFRDDVAEGHGAEVGATTDANGGGAGFGFAVAGDIVESMYANTKRPTIFPFSNPSPLSKARPADVPHRSKGKETVVTGSPFEGVVVDGNVHQVGKGTLRSFPRAGVWSAPGESDRDRRRHGPHRRRQDRSIHVACRWPCVPAGGGGSSA
ncbi:MAG: hypothetical protein LC118_20215 [Dehalococcoidia bacterium]|nr:hypothetical protein [Dehalococcoidia bacterium]